MPAHHQPARRDPELVALADQLVKEVEAFAEQIAAEIRAKVPYYSTESNVSFDDLVGSTRDNVEFVLRSLTQIEVPDVTPAEATGRRRAEQGVPLAFVMAAFRVGFSQIWKHLVESARSRGLVGNDTLVDAASDIWSAHDMFAEAMASAYREAVLTEMLRQERERSALVGALLEGRTLDETTLWDAADLLRLPSQGPFAVVAAESADLAREALPGAETRLRTQGIASAWRLLPDLQVGILRFRDDARLQMLPEQLHPIARGRVGVSPPYTRLNQTAHALRFARMALSALPIGHSGIARFDDAPLAIAAVSAPEAMERISHTVLGPVLALDDDEQRLLLATLAAWRDNGGSTDATAKQLFCHPNTVRLRLRRLESLTARRLTDPLAAAEVLLALQVQQLVTPPNQPITD